MPPKNPANEPTTREATVVVVVPVLVDPGAVVIKVVLTVVEVLIGAVLVVSALAIVVAVVAVFASVLELVPVFFVVVLVDPVVFAEEAGCASSSHERQSRGAVSRV